MKNRRGIYHWIGVLLLSLTAVLPVSAQNQTVRWSGSTEQIGEQLFRIEVRAAIASGWHIYDFGPYGPDGPNPTTVRFETGGDAVPEGELTVTPAPTRLYDEMFGMEIGTFERSVVLTQQLRLTAPQATVRAVIEYMACNDTNCTPPEEEELLFELTAAPAAAASESESAEAIRPSGSAETAETAETTASDPATTEREGSLWSFIIEAILWGFAAMLTPCVFPMVPMTVSYFLKGDGGPARGRLRAALYGLFIVALYTVPIAVIILVTRLVGGDAVTADIVNWLATHWLPNLLFFVVFMVFAASFFGAFEITMPSWMVNKSDARADTKGLGGIFFLALTLVLVSFSCTGPIVGSVLIKSTAGEFWTPIATMLAFSVAFALPFTLFALFPSVLKKLPKSGGWLNSVKVTIGFIEVALGFKFLSVADQTYHWGLLDREIYLAIWVVVFTLLGFYLLGKLKFAHDSDLPCIGVPRLALAIAVFTFVVYLIPGMWGAPLKGLSGYLPPLSTQDFVLTPGAPAPAAVAPQSARTPAGNPAPGTGKYSDLLHLPHGLQGFFDLEEARAYAAETGKPIFIDFTGHGCVNCREMEARVWSDPEVLRLLREEYVVCALYVDDKTELPESAWITTDTGKVLKSLGKINSHYALTTYGVNAQPYYVLLGSSDGRILTDPMGRNLDPKVFADFLRRGVANNRP